MPAPKLFKKFSSKSSASESSFVPDVPANDEKDDVPQITTVTADGPVPEYSDDLKEAWTAAHQELPQAQGAERFLNGIGTLTVHSNIHSSPTRPSMCNFYSVLTLN